MAEEKKEKHGLLDLLGFGMAKKAGKELAGAKGKMDKAIEEQTDGATQKDDEYKKGKNAGDLGKSYKDTFQF